jgi:hypothetical protein
MRVGRVGVAMGLSGERLEVEGWMTPCARALAPAGDDSLAQ